MPVTALACTVNTEHKVALQFQLSVCAAIFLHHPKMFELKPCSVAILRWHTCHRPTKSQSLCLLLCRPFSDKASSLPDMSTVVIPEHGEKPDGAEAGRQEPSVSVPSLALGKVPSLHGTASGNTAAMSQMSKPDSEGDAAQTLGESSPRPDPLTSEQVAALEGEAPVLLKQAREPVQLCNIECVTGCTVFKGVTEKESSCTHKYPVKATLSCWRIGIG